MPSITFGTAMAALALGVLVTLAPNAGVAQDARAAKKGGVHKPTSAAKKPDGAQKSSASKRAHSAKETVDERISRLEKTEARLRKEMQRIGGGKTPSESERKVQADINKTRDRIERVEQAEKKSGVTSKEIEAQRKKFEDQSIFKLSDIPSTAGTTALQEIAKKGLSESAGKALGPIGWGLTALDYGARKLIKERNVALMEDLLKQEHARRQEYDRLIIKLYKDLSDDIHRLKALKTMHAVYDKVTLELAKARQPARVHANLKRVDDAAGDKEEVRKAKEYGKKHMRIEPSHGRPAPRLRSGIHRSTRKYGGISRRGRSRHGQDSIAFVRDDGTVARDPDSFIRLQLKRDRYSGAAGDGDGGGGGD